MLNEAQRRHLSAVLRVTEERLLDFQRRVSGPGPRQTLLEIEDDLRPDERAAVVETVARLLALIADARRRLALAPAWQSLRQALIGSLSLTWADLQDARAAALRAYGETDPQLTRILDPLIERIAAGVSELCGTLGTDVRRRSSGD